MAKKSKFKKFIKNNWFYIVLIIIIIIMVINLIKSLV